MERNKKKEGKHRPIKHMCSQQTHVRCATEKQLTSVVKEPGNTDNGF